MRDYLSRVIFMLFSISVGLFSQSQTQGKKELSVKYVNPYINTIIQVRCDSFENAFRKQVKEKKISDTYLINTIADELKRVRYDKSNTSIDVRSKFFLLADNKVVIICFNGLNGILVNNRRIIMNRKLDKLLIECMK